MFGVGVCLARHLVLELEYKGRKLRSEFQPDFICYSQVIVELKAVKELTEEHSSQVHNYLKATGHRVGLLINFQQVFFRLHSAFFLSPEGMVK